MTLGHSTARVWERLTKIDLSIYPIHLLRKSHCSLERDGRGTPDFSGIEAPRIQVLLFLAQKVDSAFATATVRLSPAHPGAAVMVVFPWSVLKTAR